MKHRAISLCFLSIVLLAIPAKADESPSNAPVPGGAKLTGVVQREDGSTVAGAQVSLLRRGTYHGKATARTVNAEAKGAFAITDVGEGEYRIWATSDNLTSRDSKMQGQIIQVSNKPEPIQITLHPARVLRATVLSSDGKPIQGATVRTARFIAGPETPTDADGHAVLNALTLDQCEIEAFAPEKVKVSKSIHLSDGEPTEVEFSLPDGGVVRGHITDNSGTPLAGAGVNVYPGDSGMPTDYVTSGADGAYRFEHLPLEQSLRLYFGGDKFVSAWETALIPSGSRQVELSVKLQPKPAGGSVIGTVLDRDGTPIPGAKAIWYGHSTREVKSATCDERGMFRIDAIQAQPGFAEQLIVRVQGWVPISVPIEPGTKESPTEVNAQVTEKGHTIVGRLVNPKGEPIQGAYIDGGQFTVMDHRGTSEISDNQGRFKMDALPDNASFNIRATGYTELVWKKLPLDGADEVTIEMQPRAAIVGRVIDEDTKQPVAKFNIRTSARRLEQGEDFAGRNGDFKLADLQADAKVTLAVSASGYPVQYFDNVVATADSAAEPVTIELSKNPPDHVRIAGRVIDSNGRPIAGVEIYAVCYGLMDRNYPRELRFNWGMLKSGQLRIQNYIRAVESTRSGADGSFAFASLRGPDIDLAYWGNGVPQTRIENVATLADEQRQQMELKVPAPAKLSGKIDRDKYADLSHLTLRPKNDPISEMDFQIKPGADQYEIPSLAAGAYDVQIWGKPVNNPDGTFHYESLGRESVELKEGEAGELDLGSAATK